MTNYDNGRKLELAVKKLFEANGYYVMKSGGSKGAADLVAIKKHELVFVQCKTDGYVAPAERRIFVDLCYMVQAEGVVAWWRKEGHAAREIQLSTFADPYNKATLEDWSPDWALEET